jgi:hypothetical protein
MLNAGCALGLQSQAADTKWRNIILGVQRQPLVLQVRTTNDKLQLCVYVYTYNLMCVSLFPVAIR